MLLVGVLDASFTIPASTKLRYLALYFLLNLSLTIFNKAMMMNSVPCPMLITALHAFASMVGTKILYRKRYFKPSTISTRNDRLLLHGFSFLYTINIAVSNFSLSLVSVPTHQVLRTTAPLFTILIYRLLFDGSYPLLTYLALVPVLIGAALATYGDYHATLFGVLVTLLGSILAAVKTIATNRLQTAGTSLSALELLWRMAPLAVYQSLILAFLNGELQTVRSHIVKLVMENYTVNVLNRRVARMTCAIVANGIVAFGLNVISFETNKRVGALTMAVVANLKQVVAVILAFMIWKIPVNLVNALGILITLFGGSLYGYVSFRQKAPSTADHPEKQSEEGRGRQRHRNEGSSNT